MSTKKFSELGKDDQIRLRSDIDVASSALGQDDYEPPFDHPTRHRFAQYGLCATCRYLNYACSQFRVLHCRCSELEMNLTEDHPVKECTSYTNRHALSLNEMKEIAWIIDIENDPIGFKLLDKENEGEER